MSARCIKELPVLENTTIGTDRTKVWSVCVLDNNDGTFTVQSKHGRKGGALVTHETVVSEGKNVGKKNETTPEQQALLEAERDWAKKQKQGYVVVIEDAPSEAAAAAAAAPPPAPSRKRKAGKEEPVKKKAKSEEGSPSRVLKPMLATEYDEKKPPAFPVFIQPKLDGVRCLVYKGADGSLVFQSRQNTVYEPFAHLVPELEALFDALADDNIILDGELYTHGMSFQTITSIVRRSAKNKHAEADKIQYHVYDCFYAGEGGKKEESPLPYMERLEKLTAAFASRDNDEAPENIVLVQTHQAKTIGEAWDWHGKFTSGAGEPAYEGIMLRSPKGAYKQQGRSKDLLKLKTFKDDEYEVVGHEEGSGSHAGVPIFVCKCAGGTFSVLMQGSMEKRREFMKDVKSYYGKKLTVKYQELSEDGIPRFPVGIAFRDYE